MSLDPMVSQLPPWRSGKTLSLTVDTLSDYGDPSGFTEGCRFEPQQRQVPSSKVVPSVGVVVSQFFSFFVFRLRREIWLFGADFGRFEARKLFFVNLWAW